MEMGATRQTATDQLLSHFSSAAKFARDLVAGIAWLFDPTPPLRKAA
jgi:hypothetical protein